MQAHGRYPLSRFRSEKNVAAIAAMTARGLSQRQVALEMGAKKSLIAEICRANGILRKPRKSKDPIMMMIEEERLLQGLTFGELAKKSGWHKQTIAGLVSGHRNAKYAHVRDLLQALNITVTYTRPQHEDA